MSAPSLYASLLGPAFERLPPNLKSIDDARRAKRQVSQCIDQCDGGRGGGSLHAASADVTFAAAGEATWTWML